MAAEKTSSPSRARNSVIDNWATGELRSDNRLLRRDKDKSKEVTKNNSKETKIQIELTDECWGPHLLPHPPHPRATRP
jgi:hypothetical protein